MVQATVQGPAGRWRAAMIVLLVLVIAAAAAMIGAGQLLTRIAGATNLAADSEHHVWLALDGELLRLSEDGTAQASFSPGQLGIGDITAIAPTSQGRIWVGSRDRGRLYLLSADGGSLGQAAPPDSAGPFFDLIHAVYEPQSDRLIVADTQNHRLLAFSGDGHFVAASGNATPLRFPNGLAASPQGLVLLADTNHHVLQWIRPDLSLAPGTIAAPVANELEGHAVQDPWPVFVSVAPDGGLYASWHGDKLLLGGVLAYGVDGHYLHSLPLDAEAEPQALLARAEDVVVAYKSGQTFQLKRFDRQGHMLGDFGDASVQARLAAASSRAVDLRLAQGAARAILVCGGLVLLLCALRLQRRSELAASEVIVKPKRQALRGNTRVLLASVAGLLLLLIVVMGAHFGLSYHLAVEARRHGDQQSMMWLRLCLSLLVGLIVFGIALAWRATPAFLDLQTRLMKRQLQSWAPHLQKLLAPGEEVDDFAAAPSLRRGRLLVATNRRLLLLPVSAALSRKPLWQAPWDQIGETRRRGRPWWLWLLNPVSFPVEVRVQGLEEPLRFYSIGHAHAEQLIEMIEAGRERNFVRTQELVPPAALPRPSRRPASPWRGALLSLLFPGLGQLGQGRTRQGMGLMLIAAAILSNGLISWLVALRRFADQPAYDPPLLALLYLPVVIYGVWDAVRYARETVAVVPS